MTYQGYMALANDEGEDIELVNAARVKAYTDNLAPSLGLRGCDDCDGLPAALGEEYTTPTEDFAPWYDPTDPATADFYGVYPLAFDGIDDSTRTIESAELTGDGSVVVGSRYTGKDIRVTGMAFAKDDAGLYAGMSWLDSALNGTEEGRCFGDRLNVYSTCPPVEEFPEGFATPWVLTNPPDAAELAEWTTTSGTINSDPLGVDFTWTTSDPSKVACRAITGLIPDEQYQLRMRIENYGDYYVSMGEACVERYTNLFDDPRLTTKTMTLQGATVVDTHPSSGAPDGGSYFSRRMITANATSPMRMEMYGTGASGAPVEEGKEYTISWYARKSIAGGPATRADWTWYDSGGVSISTVAGTGQSVGTTWARYTQTQTAPVGAAYGQPRLAWTGTALIGQVLDFAMAMLNTGGVAVDYFDGNYPRARWQGDENDSLSVFAENVDYQTIAGWSGSEPTPQVVLDFIPRTTTMYLSIQPTDTSTATPTLDLLVEEALVHRVARPGVIAFGSGHQFVPPSDGWTHLAPATAEVTWVTGDSVEYKMIWGNARAPFGSALTYTTAHGLVRTLYGLREGARYRLLIEFNEGWAATDGDPVISLGPFVSLSDTTGAVATYTDNFGTTHYWSIEFTALGTSSVLGLHPNSNLALGSYGSVLWQIDQYLVEEILETDTTEPQAGRYQARTMYEVKASQGPILTNVRRAPCGVMGQIAFSLRAGNPFKYRSPVFAGGLPTGTSVQVPDTPCSDDGLAQVINFSYNPSLEEIPPIPNTWLGGGASLTFNNRVMSSTARLGSWVYRITADAAGSLAVVNNYYFPSSTSGGPTPQSGETLTVSGYVRAITPGTLGDFTMNCFVTMTGFPAFSVADTVNVAVVNQWYRLKVTFTLPDNITLDGIETGFFPPPDVAAAVGMEVDALMIQRGDEATAPFAQNTVGVEWSDDPNESALLLTPVAEDISADPDCPAPPAPPAPPQIDDACVAEPSAYNRTVVEVSAATVPRNLTAYPVITLTAGAAAVRQARIRFWENPDGLTIDQIYPCDYDGEIIVSYLAPGATMVIDGVLQEATVTAPGFDPQNANHALYGPNGGPVDWPELTGGIPYLVTLELDSGESYSDTIMLVDLVVKD